MTERTRQELELLRQRYPALEYKEAGQWVRIPDYSLPAGWNKTETDVVFQIPIQFPGAPPYGIYVPAGLSFNSTRPQNYNEPITNQPAFSGTWGFFSWSTEDGQWRATDNVISGYNLVNWVIGFGQRFREGI